jgi:hypothetical protein
MQNLTGGMGYFSSGKTWRFYDEYLTNIRLIRTELNDGDGIATEVTNYWEYALIP